MDAASVHALNAVDPGLTLATLPDFARVQARQMVATVKIIPYAVRRADLARAVAALRPGAIGALPFRPMIASLILTRTAGMKESIIAKGAATVEARLRGLGLGMLTPRVVAHDVAAVAEAIRAAAGDMVLILGASATSDIADTCPAALVAAGGSVGRFGMPVDPGNLLFLGTHGSRPVVGLPGCARSPALNGADWVLERLAAGLEVTGADIAAMGVGGLLKEIPARPQPRAATAPKAPGRPKVVALVLAAGASSRMRGSGQAPGAGRRRAGPAPDRPGGARQRGGPDGRGGPAGRRGAARGAGGARGGRRRGAGLRRGNGRLAARGPRGRFRRMRTP